MRFALLAAVLIGWPSPAEAQPSAPLARSADQTSASPAPTRHDGNVLAEIGGATLGYGVSVLGAIGLLLAVPPDNHDVFTMVSVGAISLWLLTSTTALGADIAGDASGGNGDFWPAFVGTLMGVFASYLILFADDEGTGYGYAAIIALPILGGTMGYATSDRNNG
jgi:hypothetical protein